MGLITIVVWACWVHTYLRKGDHPLLEESLPLVGAGELRAKTDRVWKTLPFNTAYANEIPNRQNYSERKLFQGPFDWVSVIRHQYTEIAYKIKGRLPILIHVYLMHIDSTHA